MIRRHTIIDGNRNESYRSTSRETINSLEVANRGVPIYIARTRNSMDYRYLLSAIRDLERAGG